jgi:hypothetical protein
MMLFLDLETFVEPVVVDQIARQHNPLDLTPVQIKFLEEREEILWDLLKASDYLDMKSLYFACCQELAVVIGVKSAEEIRRAFDEKTDIHEVV